MSPQSSPLAADRGARSLLFVCLLGVLVATGWAADSASREFDIPAGAAGRTLKVFAQQGGQEIVFSLESIGDSQTNAVRGAFAPREALEKMLAGTGLVAGREEKSGVFSVRKRVADPNAQRAAPSPKRDRPISRPEVDAETVELSPFVVNTSKDVGFVAGSSLAGGRLAGDLKDTPAAYSVMTREFIDALGLTELTDAMKWAVNTTLVPDDGRNEVFGTVASFAFRGVSGSMQRNFFPLGVNYDSYNLDRYDYARGPNAILFGQGSFGGTANVVTKRALTQKALQELSVSYGSWANLRTTIDVNQPFWNKQVAVRVNAVHLDRDGWRDHEMERKRAAHLAFTYQPFRNTQINVEAERGTIQRNTPTTWIDDRVSGWDGTTTFSALTSALPAGVAGLARNGSTTAQYLVYAPSTGLSNIVNFANTVRSESNNSAILGVPVVGPALNMSALPMFETVGLPANRFDRAIAGSAFRIKPGSFSISQDVPSFTQNYRIVSAFINQQVGRHLFFEAAGNYAAEGRTRTYPGVRGLAETYIDLNRNLPTGGANPEFLQPYGDAPWSNASDSTKTYNVRAAIAAVFNRTRWGDFTFNIYGGQTWTASEGRQYISALKRSTDPTTWAADAIRYRFYWDQTHWPLNDISGPVSIVDPITGVTTPTTLGWVLDTTRASQAANNGDRTLKYLQSAFSAKLWKDRINLLGAIRRDLYTAISRNSIAQRDYPLTWDGQKPYQLPAAPADFFALTYVPKSAAGAATGPLQPADTRPRDSGGLPLAQYAADRFRDDYGSPMIAGGATRTSLGTVIHLQPWLSVYGNYSESFNPPGSSRRITGELVGAQQSRGRDLGLRFSLLGGRFYASLGAYQSREGNQPVDTGGAAGISPSLPVSINGILAARVKGNPATGTLPDNSIGGRNIRGMLDVPTNYVDMRDRENNGYELDAVANLSQSWRLTFNAAAPRAHQSNAYSDTRAWVARSDTVLRQILSDAGVTVDAGNRASVDPAVPTAFRSPDASAAASHWNNLIATTNNLVTGAQRISRLNELQLNLFSDYTVREGRFKGVKFGGGVNYRGREIIGYKGSDTVLNPADPTGRTAIDDPTVDAYTPFYADPNYVFTGTLGYSFKLTRKIGLRLDLRVNNLLNWTKPLYVSTVQRPPKGDISTPVRVATPALYNWLTPRSYTFTSTVSF